MFSTFGFQKTLEIPFPSDIEIDIACKLGIGLWRIVISSFVFRIACCGHVHSRSHTRRDNFVILYSRRCLIFLIINVQSR